VKKQWGDPKFTAETLAAARETLAGATSWDHSFLEGELRKLAESRGTTGGKIFQPLRVALTGLAVSPGIFDVLHTLGRERSLARVDAAVAYIRKGM
jgi:glutamyl-tRNA synthetase